MDVTLTGTAVVNLFLLHLEWTVRSNDIINPSIYNSADNVVICVLGLWGGCLGHEGHQQFPWSSGVHPFSSHRLAYVQFLQSSLVHCHWVTIYFLIASPNKERGAGLTCEAEKPFGPPEFSSGVTCQPHSASDLVWHLSHLRAASRGCVQNAT